jgi:hypothetical protein
MKKRNDFGLKLKMRDTNGEQVVLQLAKSLIFSVPKQAKSLSLATKEDIIKFFQQFILKNGPLRKKLVVTILPQNVVETINSDEIIL